MNGRPMSNSGAGILLRNRRTGRVMRVPHEALQALYDRWAQAAAAASGGRGVPETVHPNDPNALGYQPFPDGVPSVPPAEWEQRPEGVSAQFTQPGANEVRWGDMRTLDFPTNVAGPAVVNPTQAILNTELQLPAVCMIRLSAVETTGALAAPGPNDLATFTLDIGVGAALQSKQFQVQVAPKDGSAQTDLVLTFPVQMLRVSATVRVVNNAADHNIQVLAQVAPFTSLPQNVR